MVYWTTRGNTSILNECSKWMDTTAYQQDLEEDTTRLEEGSKKFKTELTSKYLVWVQLLLQSERKSEIVENEEEYYATNDPSRQFREMELKSLATKELIINEEFEDEDDDGSDDDSESGDESDQETQQDDEDDDNSMLSNFGNHRKISLKPKHKKIFQQMIDDRFAMALLHLSASDFFDDSPTAPLAHPTSAFASPPPIGADGASGPDDFNLFHNSQKICQRSVLSTSFSYFPFHSPPFP